MLSSTSEEILTGLPKELSSIQDKIYSGERITEEEGLLLFERGSLPFLGSLANYIREKNTAISLISTGIFTSSPPMFAFSLVIFAAIAACMRIVRKAGNFLLNK